MVCDGNCFNCPYADCVDNSLPRENESLEPYLPKKPKREWYERNRERVRIYNANYKKRKKDKHGKI